MRLDSILDGLRARIGWPPRRHISVPVVSSVFDLAEGLVPPAPFDARMAHLCRWTATLLACDRVSIFLREGDRFHAHFNFGNPPDIAAVFSSLSFSAQNPLMREVFAQRDFLVVNDARNSPRISRALVERARINAIALAPLFDGGGGELGFITAEYNERHGRFDEIESSFLLGCARLAQIVVANERETQQRARADARNVELVRRVGDLERLEALGRLSGGVAHDMNNLLTVILGHCDLLRLDSSEPAALEAGLYEISSTAERAASLTRQLLAFGRRQVLLPEVLDPVSVARGVGKMLRRLIPESIEIQISAQPDVGAVSADRSQLEQVLVNLAINARDAMPGGGKLEIALSNVELDETRVRDQPGAQVGPHVCIAVTDSGSGISSEDLEHVFEPFFTTRSEGTGLGLATVYGIVRQSGGTISVESEARGGATVRVHLPRVEGAPLPQRAEPPRVEAPGGQLVLVVDDDESVRRTIGLALVGAGHQAVLASDLESAQRALARHERVSLLVTDVVMAAESGPELARALRRTAPSLRVLFVSGYAPEALGTADELGPGTGFLAKPFSPRELLDKVSEVLQTPLPRE